MRYADYLTNKAAGPEPATTSDSLMRKGIKNMNKGMVNVKDKDRRSDAIRRRLGQSKFPNRPGTPAPKEGRKY